MLKENFSNFISTVSLSLDEHGPEIGFWAGLGLIVGGTGWAIYESLKRVPEINNEYRISNKDISIRKAVEGLSDEEIDELLKPVKGKRNKSYIKAYMGPLVLFLSGVVLQIGGHVEDNHRFEVLAGDFAALVASNGAYRKRVADFVGEDKEKALYYGKEIKQVEVEDTDENGNVVGTHTESYIEGDVQVPLNPFTFEFSTETTDFCSGNKEYDLAFLKMRQAEWGNILSDNPAVFLNEILRALGMREELIVYRKVGWLNKKWYKTAGDGYIDFRITPVEYVAPDGKKRWKFMLDFNCDGNIEDMIVHQRGLMGVAQRQIDELSEEIR